MSARFVVLPCETQARELDAKLLLAACAAERGFRVIVGSKKEINKRLASLPAALFLSKSLTRRNLLNYTLLERLGHSIVCGDEEALVYASPDSYRHHKVSDATLGKARALLAWGPQNESLWRGCAGWTGAPIRITGNARMDLLRPELRSLFRAEADRLRDRFGSFVLVNTNFSRLNHYFPGQSRQRRALERGGDGALATGLAAHKAALYRAFLEMVPALARRFPEQRIVVRPHPSEQRSTWEERVHGLPNVAVLHEGNVVPWLMASEVVVHNGCQTAVEAYLLGEPAIAYQPVTSESFDLQLPNLLSHRAFDLEALHESVAAALGGGGLRASPSEAEKREELVEQYVAARRGDLASDRIARALDELASGELAPVRVRPADRLLAGAVARGRGALQRVEAYWPGHHNNRVFLRHVFPGASEQQVRERIARYGDCLGRFERVRVRRRWPNVFDVEAA